MITGCSSGVGRSLALQLARQGAEKFKVFATMRNPKSITPEGESLDNLVVSQLDVTSDESVNNFMKDLNQVDILVNNAGYAINGTHETNSMETVKAQFETNFFGIVRLQQRVLPLMRAQKSGHLIAVSSVGGLLGVPFNDIYCATKFALEGLYESMASLNLQLGIQTTLIEPGAINTSFVSNVDRPEADGMPEELRKPYEKYQAAMGAAFANSTAQTADEVAEVIVKAINDGLETKASLRYQTSPNAQKTASMKIVDTTGDSLVKGSTARFFSQ